MKIGKIVKRMFAFVMAALLLMGSSVEMIYAENGEAGQVQSQTQVNVEFLVNDGTATWFSNSSPFSQYGISAESGKTVGSILETVSDFAGVSNVSDPVFWEASRGFAGWKICTLETMTDDTGNSYMDWVQVPGSSILSTADLMAYVVPGNVSNIGFFAQWSGNDNDYYTNVYIDGFGRDITFLDTTDPSSAQPLMKGGTIGNYYREDGTSVKAQMDTILPVPGYRDIDDKDKLEGWLEYRVSYMPNGDSFITAPVSDKLYTTDEMLAKAVPAEDTQYVAKWSDVDLSQYPGFEGSNDDEIVQTDIFGNGGIIKLTTPDGNVVEVDKIGNQFPIGSTLRENGFTFTDPTHDTWKFLGWCAFEPGEIGPNMTRLDHIPMMTTEELLDFELQPCPIFFMAQWNTGDSDGNSGDGNSGESEGDFDAWGNLFIYGNGGYIDYKYYENDKLKDAINAGLFIYEIDADKAFKKCMDERKDGIVKIHKQCGKVKGWELYTCDHVEFFNVPAGENVVVSDGVTLEHLMQLRERDYYVLMKNPVKEKGLKTTDDIYNLSGAKEYFAMPVWEDAHTEVTVTENKIPATTTEKGGYDKVVYCKECGKELSRTIEYIDKLPVPTKPENVTSEQISQVKDAVQNIVKDAANANEAKETIANTLDKEVIKKAMVDDAEFKSSIQSLEESYKEEQKITVEKPSVDKDIEKIVNKDSISVVGAGLNGTYKSKVKLDLSNVAKPVEVTETYKNAVQIDIKLMVNDKSKSKLDIPVSITMDIPDGLDMENLVILHYHGDSETPELIRPLVKDGKISFAVNHFSTFVFANEENDAPTASEWNAYLDILNGVNGNTTVKSPKTGDNSVALLVAVFALATAGVVVYRRKTVR